jgi:hypothetical protein
MALTPGGTPYVESSDLVADYPTVSLALAEHIDDLPAKILQVVRATDTTLRTTTSTSFVDASISVTISPQKSDSAVILIWAANAEPIGGSNNFQEQQITDSSNNPISGSEEYEIGGSSSISFYHSATLFAYATPGTTSAVTFKGRFRANTGGTTARLINNQATGQMYAIEVSA